MLSINLSKSEELFISNGIIENVRADGRQNNDFRDILLQNYFLTNTNGSGRISLGINGTDVIAAVKIEIGEPLLETPDLGRIECNVECSPIVCVTNNNNRDDMNAELTKTMERILRDSHCLKLKDLCIVPKKFCWIIYLDIMVLSNKGNILDAISIASYMALNKTLIPKISVKRNEETGEIDDFELAQGHTDVELLDATDVPICITMNKIANCIVVDTNEEEEQCVSSRVIVAIDKWGKVRGIHKGSTGGLLVRELTGLVTCAVNSAEKIFDKIDRLFNNDDDGMGNDGQQQEDGGDNMNMNTGGEYDIPLDMLF